MQLKSQLRAELDIAFASLAHHRKACMLQSRVISLLKAELVKETAEQSQAALVQADVLALDAPAEAMDSTTYDSLADWTLGTR